MLDRDHELEATVVEGEGKLVTATCPFCHFVCKWVALRQEGCKIFHNVREVCEHVSSVTTLHKPRMTFKVSQK